MTKKKARKKKGKRKARTGERGLPLWPRNKPMPKFKSYEEEVEWWHSYDYELGPDNEWEELVYEPQATRQPRQHVYRVRFNDEEMAILQALAKRRSVTASVIIRELVREHGPPRR